MGVNSRSITWRLAAVATLLFAATGCIGPLSQTSGTRSSSNNGFAPASGGSSSSTSVNTLCSRYDTSDPSRGYCTDCQAQLISQYCAPGTTSVSSCTDSRFKRDYPNLLNQCIAQSEQVGRVCTLTCGLGQTLNRTSCSCETLSGGTGSGAAGQNLIDTGQFDSGPPVVRLNWDTSKLRNPENFGPVTAQMQGVTFEVRNRGGSHPRDNVYTVLESFCEDPAISGAGATSIGAVGHTLTIPAPNGFVNGVNRGATASAQFTLTSQGPDYARKGFEFNPDIIPDSFMSTPTSSTPLAGDAANMFGSTTAPYAPYLGSSLALGKYVTQGDLPQSMSDTSGDTTLATPGFVIRLNSTTSRDAGAGYTAALAPRDTTYRLWMEILALDGWTGVTQTFEALYLYAGFPAQRVNAPGIGPYLAVIGNLFAPGDPNNSVQYFPTQTRGTFQLNGSAVDSYKLTVNQSRTGFDLESRLSCVGTTCAADSIVYVGMENIPRSLLRLELDRTSGATTSEQRLGIRKVQVDPTGGYPRCSIKYQFRDANQQSSYYCLVFEARTKCGPNSQNEASCILEPVIANSGETNVGFFPVTQSQKCFCKPHNGGCCIPQDSNNDGIITSADSCVTNSSSS
jgi:hypothetical protein